MQTILFVAEPLHIYWNILLVYIVLIQYKNSPYYTLNHTKYTTSIYMLFIW